MTAGSAIGRIRRMSRSELRWRAGVAVHTTTQRAVVGVHRPQWNRRDIEKALAPGALSARTRAALATRDWRAAHDAIADAMRARPARFVLDPASAVRVRSAIDTRWPAAVSGAVDRAQRVLSGRYDILGYRDLSFVPPAGRDEDWHFDPVHQRSAPRIFWADVPYLDPRVGDHKVIWEINRHQHCLHLGRALWLTGDSRYAEGIVERLESWLAANPPLIGINWASMLEIGFRALSWTWGLHFLLAGQAPADLRSPGSQQPWLVDMLVALDRQLVHLEQNLSYYFSPNTHLTGEALALYVVGIALPELAGSARWVETGRRILMGEIHRQILADGGHVERSMHYQRYTLDFYLLALLTARIAGDADAIVAFTDAITRLAEFTRIMADDNGRLASIGDDDGGTLWPIAGRACNDVRDSLALAATILRRPDLAPWGTPEEVWWLAERSASACEHECAAHRAATSPLSSRVLTESGYVVARDGAGGQAILDAGAHGYLNGGHAHADALALTLSLSGRPLLVDSGTSTYTMNLELRDRMRSTSSHNTVTVDGRSQAIPAGPFHWRTRADSRLHASRHNPAFDWAETYHDAYAPVRHRRTLFRHGDRGWLIIDELVGLGPHLATAHWHFDPAWTLTHDAPGRLRATDALGGGAWLLHDVGTASLLHGDRGSGLGWRAPVYGVLVPAWTARIAHQEDGPFAMVTWIGAMGRMEGEPLLQRIQPIRDGEAAIGVRVTDGDSVSVFLKGEGGRGKGEEGGVLDLQTDARVLHYDTRGDQLIALDLIEAACVRTSREGWLSLDADDTISDLHLSLDRTELSLVASTPPPAIRLRGTVLGTIRRLRLNGRDHPMSLGRLSDGVLILGGDWKENIFPIRRGLAFA